MPDTTQPQKGMSQQGSAGGNGSQGPRAARASYGDALTALSAASGNYARGSAFAETRDHGASPPPRQRVTFVFPTLGAIAVGFVLLIAGRNVHLCGATFRLPEKLDSAQRDLCRNTLYDVVSADLGFTRSAGGDRNFFVDFPTRNTLRFAHVAPKSAEMQDQAKRLADGFLVRMELEMRRARGKPSEGEVATAANIVELEASLAAEHRVLDQALAEVPKEDHRAQRDGLLGRWKNVREKYRLNRVKLTEVARSFEKLRGAPPPSHGIVSAEQRRKAFSADLGLQQDLKELSVSLAEVRGHIGRLQKNTTALQAQLDQAALKLAEVLHSVDLEKIPKSTGGTVKLLADDTDGFRKSLDEFSATWTLELTAIRSMPIEPRSQELLERYRRTRSALGTFLFDTSKVLTRMRESARNIDAVQSDNGRVLQLQARVSRSFQALQAFYHRFEFAASQIDRPQNFRLDAALRSAGGLRRRSAQRMQQIDTMLQRAALKRMKAFQATSLQQAELLLKHARSDNDETVSALVELQDQLSERVGTVEDFVTAVARSEMATRNVESLRSTLDQARARLAELQTRRKSRGENTRIELATAGILGPPINVAERFRNSAIGAAITLLGLLAGQWWVARRT